ncbi:MAG: protein AbiQ [Phenylobacterium sp.]
MELKFFTVDEGYIQYLKKYDSKVPDNYSSTKPFIGVLFRINGLDYIAPLTSAKPKHEKIKNSSPTAFKVFENNTNQKMLALVQLNNMIPVKSSNIQKLDVATFDLKYQFLLLKEINYIRSNKDKLIKKAQKLYDMVTIKQISNFVDFSCDFKALEAASQEFKR